MLAYLLKTKYLQCKPQELFDHQTVSNFLDLQLIDFVQLAQQHLTDIQFLSLCILISNKKIIWHKNVHMLAFLLGDVSGLFSVILPKHI